MFKLGQDSAVFRFVASLKGFLALAGITLFLSRIGTWFYPYGSDHWIFYYVGKAIIEGKILYLEVWDHKAPLIFYFNSLLHLWFDDNLFLHRFLFTLLSILDTVIFYFLVKKILSLNIQDKFKLNLLTHFLVLVYIFWRNLSQFTSSGNNTENLAIIFIQIAYLSFLNFQTKSTWLRSLWIGLSTAVVVFLKINLAILLLPLFIELVFFLFQKDWSKAFKIILSGLLSWFLFFGFFGWIFYIQGNLEALIEAAFTFNSNYWKVAWKDALGDRNTFLLIDSFLLIPLISAFGLLSLKVREERNNSSYRFVYFSLLTSLIFSLLSGNFYPYYFLVIIPSLVCGLALVSKNWAVLDLNNLSKKFLVGSFLACSFFSVLISYRQAYNTFLNSSFDQETEEIGKYIKENSKPEDTFFAYIYGATLYQQAERQSASRFISATPMYIDNRYDFDLNFNQIFLEDLEKQKPKFIVLPLDSKAKLFLNQELIAYFRKNYSPVKSFETLEVLERNSQN